MAAAQLSVTRRALLAGACSLTALSAPSLPRKRESGFNAPEERSGIPDQVRDDEKWNKALAHFRAANAALAAAEQTEDEDLYDRLGVRHERALQRFLRTPAPTVAALATKLDLALYDDALEFIGDEAAMKALKQDAHRLAASAA
jgi:hypothetical protein